MCCLLIILFRIKKFQNTRFIPQNWTTLMHSHGNPYRTLDPLFKTHMRATGKAPAIAVRFLITPGCVWCRVVKYTVVYRLLLNNRVKISFLSDNSHNKIIKNKKYGKAIENKTKH